VGCDTQRFSNFISWQAGAPPLFSRRNASRNRICFGMDRPAAVHLPIVTGLGHMKLLQVLIVQPSNLMVTYPVSLSGSGRRVKHISISTNLKQPFPLMY
jgi:hypothetical protein